MKKEEQSDEIKKGAEEEEILVAGTRSKTQIILELLKINSSMKLWKSFRNP